MRNNSLKITKPKVPARKKTVSTPENKPHASRDIEVQEKIGKKAYELFEQRGCTHGCDWNDWFEAERIVTGKSSRP